MSSSHPTAAAGASADPDLSLVRLVQAGDRDAFQPLVRRYEHAIYRMALAIMRNDADAEEITQETFLRAYQHLRQFRGESRFSTWLTQIAINAARMRLRKSHAAMWESLDEPRAQDEGQMAREAVDTHDTPEQNLAREEQRQRIALALSGLPAGYRLVLVLRDLQELSTHDTARILKLSDANVKTRLLRARQMLRQRLTRLATAERGIG